MYTIIAKKTGFIRYANKFFYFLQLLNLTDYGFAKPEKHALWQNLQCLVPVS